MPQPDLMLLRPREDFYSARLPTPADILLLVEVSESSLSFDQGIKRALYARQGVAEYWVFDLPGRRVHVYRDPTVEGYGDASVHTLNEAVSPRALPAVQVVPGTVFA